MTVIIRATVIPVIAWRCLCNNMQDTDLAAAYSESPSPSQSAKGSFTNLGAESAQGSRGNKENEGGIRRNRAGSESKYFDKQNHVLLGEAAAYSPPRPPTPCHKLTGYSLVDVTHEITALQPFLQFVPPCCADWSWLRVI